MTHLTTHRGVVSRRRASLFAAFTRALDVWRQRQHLSALPPHMRRDIGLTDSEIAQETDRVIWDVPHTWRH